MLTNKTFKEKILKIKFGTIFAIATVLASTGLVSAEEIIITGNGSGTTSSVTNSSNQTANISQTNSQDTNNNIQTDTNTGGNNTSGNTGGSNNIETGNTTVDIEITNTGNSNSSDVGCCNDSAETTVISGNGTGSENNVSIVSTNTTTINSNNKANITNNIRGIANTGNNVGNKNTNGNIYIKTGNISVSEKITNGPLNFNNTSSVINATKSSSYILKVSGNGSHSTNIIDLDLNSENNINISNALDILNESVWLLNTGYNEVNDNTGSNVDILTGDINFLASILNGPINVNNVEIKCCENEKKIEEPTGGVTPVTPPPAAKVESKPAESKPSDGPKGGEVLAAAVGNMLPVTGNYTHLFFMIGNVAMFLLGMVLRLRSGRSPGFVKVVA